MFLTWLHRKQWQPFPSRRQRRPAVRCKSTPPRLEPLEDRLLLSTYLVTNTNDSGDGSLRQAILDANATPGTDTIAFNIGGGGVQTIQPTSALPTITDPVVIDGTTQPGYAGQPLIELNGASGGGSASGLVVAGGSSTVRGLVVDRFGLVGVWLQSAGGDVVEGNYIGTDPTGQVAAPNLVGVVSSSANNTVGGTAAGAGNVISGNGSDGVQVVAGGTVVQGNYIGTDASGTQPLGNGQNGVYLFGANNSVVGGVAAGAGNVISANAVRGIDDYANNITVQGNHIGTDVSGTRPLGNGQEGVYVGGSISTVGGAAAGAGNVISGNGSVGVWVVGSDNTVQGNYIGTDVSGTQPLGNGGGVSVAGPRNTVGGTGPGAGNLISANRGGGMSIGGTGTRVQGNYIGTDASGTQPLGNGREGVFIYSIADTVIGGAAAGAHNVISANGLDGVALVGGGGTVVQGNYIGTDASGTRALGNGGNGIVLSDGVHFFPLIGGAGPGMGNVISGNAADGIAIGGTSGDQVQGTQVQGNYIGTDASGTQPLGNGGYGVEIRASSNDSAVGAPAAGAGNVISANALDGVLIRFTTGTQVQGNYVGTDATGIRPLGNGGNGVYILGSNTVVGGTTAVARNVISANRLDGVFIGGSGDDRVQGNYIGTDVTGTRPLGNGSNGVAISGSDNVIGGTGPGAGNLISANGASGVGINFGQDNIIQGNRIGTDVSGASGLGNSVGVSIAGSNNTAGGTATGAGNLISGNDNYGVILSLGSGNLVQGNLIGTDISGTKALGNGADGVAIQNASGNTIGGTTAGAGNTIAFNGHDGVLVDTGTGNAILSDLIFSSGHLGIELINNGNNNQAAPRLLAAVQNGSNTRIVGMLRSTPNTTFTLQFFSDPSPDPSGLGEGQQLLGTFTVTTNAAGIAPFAITIPTLVPAGQIITATATDPNNNTSEFSLPVGVRGGADDGQAVLYRQQPLGVLVLSGDEDSVSQTLSPLGSQSQPSTTAAVTALLWPALGKKLAGQSALTDGTE